MIDEKYKNPEILTFDSGVEGSTLTVLGAVHGDEPCGPRAIKRVLAAIESGKIRLLKGKFVTIPVVNLLAEEKNVRFVERNLNRFLYPKENPKDYEDFLDLKICPVLEETDYLLDLHSYHSKGSAFVFLGVRDEANISYARALGVPRIIYGWADAMKANDDVADKREAMGTTEYSREFGAISVTLECGHHHNPEAADVGFNAILNAMKYTGIAEVDEDLFVTSIPESESYDIKMGGMFLKTRAGKFLEDWTNMNPVSTGDVIARYDDGEEVSMPEDGFLVLPHKEAPIMSNWFFWGVPEKL